MHWFVSVFLSYAWTWLLCQTCWSSCWLERRNRRAAAAAGASRMAHSCHASSLFCHCPSSLPQAPTIIFMLFTQQQPLAVNLKSSFVNIIFLHFIKSQIMDLGRNHTCFCTKTLVMTPAVLHTSFWPHGADLHILYRSGSHIYAQWLWHAQECWDWWWSRKVYAQSDEQVLSLWATKRHTC